MTRSHYIAVLLTTLAALPAMGQVAELGIPVGMSYTGPDQAAPVMQTVAAGPEIAVERTPPVDMAVPEPQVAPQPGPVDDFAGRIARLEAENQRMMAELQWLREHPTQAPNSGIPATPVAMAAPPEAPLADPGVTMPQVDAEVKKLMWTKGDFKIVPYGWLWGNTVYETERTNPGSYTLWVLTRSQQPESETIVDARNTRIGFDVAGPRIPCLGCAQSGGKVEIDFQGSFAAGNTENKGAVLLRHAYAEVKNDDFRLLAGQTWDVISPLNPGMLMYSVGWDGGNIGYRRAQFRAERYLAVSDLSLLTLQAAICQNVFPDTFARTAGTVSYTAHGEPAQWPIVESRVAWTLGDRKCPDALPITFGVSGHIGQTEFDLIDSKGNPLAGFDNQLRLTWSVNGDIRIPITHHLGFQAEFFTGENLGQFLGGIGQGLDTTTGDEIRSTGGWCEIWYDWTPCLHSHFGYSIDDPNNNDLHTTGERTYNQFYYGNVIYDLTKQFIVGLEVSSWRTLFVNQLPGESVRCEFVAKYGF